ncbi:uncharacterized protein LOC129258875 isoform X1 [Lytechinus pictus]|uniref:uncharacterized protein LOC129258875 isoform X1 n=1 Tax=Lytechinus pictus TaxID=7653 RepID=UPI0030BA2685
MSPRKRRKRQPRKLKASPKRKKPKPVQVVRNGKLQNGAPGSLRTRKNGNGLGTRRRFRPPRSKETERKATVQMRKRMPTTMMMTMMMKRGGAEEVESGKEGEGEEGKGEEQKSEEKKVGEKKKATGQVMQQVELDEEALLKDPFWDQLEKGLIEVSFETDMYSKVKNRRAVLDAKREEKESKDKEDKKSKKKKKKKEHKKEKKAKKEKKKKDKHKKTKKMVDLEMLGSLESATKRTLMMSPSALDTSANSANMYRSTVPSEQILTIAQLEEKSKEAASVSGGTTPCKLESLDSSSSSSSSTISQEITPESPSSEKPTDPHSAFFGDLCKMKTEALDIKEETSQLQDFANILPTPEVDEADRQICDAVLTPLSPCDVDRGLEDLPSEDPSLQETSILNRLGESDSNSSVQACPKTNILEDDKPLSNLPTPPEVDNRSMFSVLQSGSGSADTVAKHQDPSSTAGQSAQSNVYNMYHSEHSKVDYRVQDVNLFGNLRPAMGNVQMDVNSAKKGESVDATGHGMQGKASEPSPSNQFQPPTPPASLFSSFSSAVPKPSPLMPLSEGTPNRTPDLKSPLNSPLTPHTPSTSFTPQATPQGTPSPKSYLASQKSPPFPNASPSGGGRNAFEKIQTFQLSSAHGRNSAKVQSLKDKLSKYVSPTSRKEDSLSSEKSDISHDQQQQQLNQLQSGQLSELSVDTGLANTYRSSDVAGQPQPLSQIERQIQRIDTQETDRTEDKGLPLSHPAPGTLPLNQESGIPEPQRQDSLEGLLGNGIPSSNTAQGMGSLATYDGLRQAIKGGNTQGVVHMLQQTGPRALEEVDNMGTTPLMLACTLNQDGIVKALILNGAIVNKTHKNGMTPLMMAAEKGYTSTLGILLEAGAYINSTTPAGESALMQACRRGHKDVVRLLLEYGANWMVTARDGSSALGFAMHHSHRSVQDMLHAHVQRLCCKLEETASQFLYGTARLLKSVFPLHCYRLREATEHLALVSFDANNYYCYQGSGMLLFLAQATLGPGWSISCKLSGSSYIKQVLLNGRNLPQLTQGSNFVLSYTPRSGQNVLTISTVPDPYTNTLLLVGAYTVQIGTHPTAMH